MAIWYHLDNTRLSTKKNLFSFLIQIATIASSAFLFWHCLSYVFSLPLVQGVLHSSDNPGWTFQFGSTSFDHEWLELLTTYAERSLKCLNTNISTHPLEALHWIHISFFHGHVTLMAQYSSSVGKAGNQCTQILFLCDYFQLWASRRGALTLRCLDLRFGLLIFYYFGLQGCPVFSFII